MTQQTYLRLARSREEAGDLEGALEAVNAALKIDADAHCYHTRGWLFLQMRRAAEARDDFDRAISLGFAFALCGRGASQEEAGDYATAVADWTELIDNCPEEPDPFMRRAWVRFQHLDDGFGALSDYTKALELSPGNPVALRCRGWVRMNFFRDHVGALADFDAAVARNDPDAYSARAMLRRNFLNDPSGALTDYDEAIRLNPADGLMYSNRGIYLIQQNRYHEALADLDRAVNLDPLLVLAITNRAILRLRLGHLELALKDINNACSLTVAGTAMFCSAELADLMRDFTGIIVPDDFTLIVRSCATAHVVRGLIRHQSEPLKAVEDYRTAAGLSMAPAQFLLGVVLWELGDFIASVPAFVAIPNCGIGFYPAIGRILRGARWAWRVGDGTWAAYPPTSCAALSQATCRSTTSCEVEATDGSVHCVNLLGMTFTSSGTASGQVVISHSVPTTTAPESSARFALLVSPCPGEDDAVLTIIAAAPQLSITLHTALCAALAEDLPAVTSFLRELRVSLHKSAIRSDRHLLPLALAFDSPLLACCAKDGGIGGLLNMAVTQFDTAAGELWLPLARYLTESLPALPRAPCGSVGFCAVPAATLNLLLPGATLRFPGFVVASADAELVTPLVQPGSVPACSTILELRLISAVAVAGTHPVVFIVGPNARFEVSRATSAGLKILIELPIVG